MTRRGVFSQPPSKCHCIYSSIAILGGRCRIWPMKYRYFRFLGSDMSGSFVIFQCSEGYCISRPDTTIPQPLTSRLLTVFDTTCKIRILELKVTDCFEYKY